GALVAGGWWLQRAVALAPPRIAHGARPARAVRRAGVRRCRRGRLRPPRPHPGLAPGARRPPGGARGAGHVGALRGAHRAAAPAGPGLAGAAPARLGPATLGAPAPGVAPPAAGRPRPRLCPAHSGEPARAEI